MNKIRKALPKMENCSTSGCVNGPLQGRFLAYFCCDCFVNLKSQDTRTLLAEKKKVSIISAKEQQEEAYHHTDLLNLFHCSHCLAIDFHISEFGELGKPGSASHWDKGAALTLAFLLGVVCSTLNNLGFLVPNAPCSSGFFVLPAAAVTLHYPQSAK